MDRTNYSERWLEKCESELESRIVNVYLRLLLNVLGSSDLKTVQYQTKLLNDRKAKGCTDFSLELTD